MSPWWSVGAPDLMYPGTAPGSWPCHKTALDFLRVLPARRPRPFPRSVRSSGWGEPPPPPTDQSPDRHIRLTCSRSDLEGRSRQDTQPRIGVRSTNRPSRERQAADRRRRHPRSRRRLRRRPRRMLMIRTRRRRAPRPNSGVDPSAVLVGSSAVSRFSRAEPSSTAPSGVTPDNVAGTSARTYLPGLTMMNVGMGGSGKCFRRLRLRSCIFLICSGAESRGITESWTGAAGSEDSPDGFESESSGTTPELPVAWNSRDVRNPCIQQTRRSHAAGRFASGSSFAVALLL